PPNRVNSSATRSSSIRLPNGVSQPMYKNALPLSPPEKPVAIPVRIPEGRARLEQLKKSPDGGALASATGAPESANGPIIKAVGAAKTGPSIQTTVNWCGNVGAAGGFAPSDSHGAVGRANFITVKNVTVGVYRIAGCAVVAAEQSLKTFFAPVGVPSTATLFDPRVIYDKWTDRFFLTAESSDSNTDQYQYFAVSKDGTGTSWWLYRITLSQGASVFCKQAANSFWDYPNVGSARGNNPAAASGRGRWFITANDFGTTTTGAILSIDKAATLTGGSPTVKCFSGLAFNLAPPIVISPSWGSQFLSPGSGGGSTIARLNLWASDTGAGADFLSSIANVAIPAWSAPPNAAQPNGTTLDSLDGRFQSASIQARDMIWNVHSIGLSGFSKIRMYRMSTDPAITAPLTVFTPTTAANEHLFNPSVATAAGAVNAPAFITMTRTIPSSATTGRATMLMLAGLNASTLSEDWQLHYISQSSTQFVGCSPCRWGDYSATQVDPWDSGKGWGFNQLVTGTTEFNWVMRAAGVTLNLGYKPVASGE
ncbi:MAG: hypothetical protein KDJ44_19800, partial [Rhodoblastus sp.]|nr:hypothetical protein [Rhodoblastus sp.]